MMKKKDKKKFLKIKLINYLKLLYYLKKNTIIKQNNYLKLYEKSYLCDKKVKKF